MTRYAVKHVADPYEHFWEFHVIDQESGEAVAVCGVIAFADIICTLLNESHTTPRSHDEA